MKEYKQAKEHFIFSNLQIINLTLKLGVELTIQNINIVKSFNHTV